MIPPLTKDQLLSAIEKFDSELRLTPQWKGWENKQIQKYAINHDGRLYPPKRIVALAANTNTHGFAGGRETNTYLQERGFEIISLRKKSVSDEDESDGLRQAFLRVFETLPDTSRQLKIDKASDAWIALSTASELLRKSPIIESHPELTVNFSPGKGYWTFTPWIGVLDVRETRSSQRGIYCVYLFRADKAGVYLTLNQGVTDIVTEHGLVHARELLTGQAELYRQSIADLEEQDFRLDNKINLQSDVHRGISYESSTIAYKYYPKDSFPDDESHLDDLEALLGSYRELVAQRLEHSSNNRSYWIFQANPQYYDIQSAMNTLQQQSFLVRQHASEIKAGDTVFFWQSGPDAGIVATGSVLTEPADREVGPEELQFQLNHEKFAGPQRRVIVSYDRILSKTLPKSAISQNAALTQLSILRFFQGSNFRVEQREAKELLSMIERSESSVEETVSTVNEPIGRKTWLFAPGENARHFEEFYRDGIIAIGWDELGDLTLFSTQAEILRALQSTYKDYDNPTNNARTCYEFCHEIKDGDFVFAKKGTGEIVGAGVITSGYKYDQNRKSFRHVHSINWTHKGSWDVAKILPRVIKTLTEIGHNSALVAELVRIIGVSSAVSQTAPVALPKYTIEDACSELFMSQDKFRELLDLWDSRMNLILQGPPGVGKTFLAKRLAYALLGVRDPSRVGIVQFHQSFSYEDFIRGFRPSENGFVLQDGLFYSFCRRAAMDRHNKYVFIVDEINRGNLSKILGETLLLLESDKRGPEFALPLSYAKSLEDRFFIPENLYLIGTMNTADRSIAVVDYALRRRFCFATLDSMVESSQFKAYLLDLGVPENDLSFLIDRLSALNRTIAEDKANLGTGYCIGHSYFCRPIQENSDHKMWLRRIVLHDIAPLLREYWFDSPERAETEIGKLVSLL